MADWHWEPVTDDLLDALPSAAQAAVRQVAEELTVRESMIFLDGREFTGEPPGLRTVQRGPLMLGQAAHGMPDKVKAPDPRLPQHHLSGLDQERDRYLRQVLAGGFPARQCVVGEERAPGEGGLERDVGVIFLG